jgi:hypothetical protein
MRLTGFYKHTMFQSGVKKEFVLPDYMSQKEYLPCSTVYMMAYYAHHIHSTTREICMTLTPRRIGILKVARKQAFSFTKPQ